MKNLSILFSMAILSLLALSVMGDFVPHEKSRWALIDSLITGKGFEVDPHIAGLDVAKFDDHYYSAFSPGLSLLLSPYTLLVRILFGGGFPEILALRFLSIAVTTFSAIVIYKLLSRFSSRRSAIISTMLIIYATPIYAFSETIFSHIYVMLFLMLSLYYLLNLEKASSRMIVSTSLAMAFLIEYQSIITFLPIYIYCILQKKLRDVTIYLIPLSIVLGFHLYYNLVIFKHPLNFPEKFWIGYPSRPAETLHMFSTPLHLGLYMILFSPENGLFMISPILLLAIFGFKRLWRLNRWLTILILNLWLINLLFYSTWHLPWGGSSFGPRFLIPLIPTLSIPLSLMIDEKIRNCDPLKIFPLFVIAFYSVATSTLGAITSPDILFNGVIYDLIVNGARCLPLSWIKLNPMISITYWIIVTIIISCIISYLSFQKEHDHQTYLNADLTYRISLAEINKITARMLKIKI